MNRRGLFKLFGASAAAAALPKIRLPEPPAPKPCWRCHGEKAIARDTTDRRPGSALGEDDYLYESPVLAITRDDWCPSCMPREEWWMYRNECKECGFIQCLTLLGDGRVELTEYHARAMKGGLFPQCSRQVFDGTSIILEKEEWPCP